MREFFIVLKFELMNFFKNKSFIISTIILMAIAIIGLSAPTIKDTFFSGGKAGEGELDAGGEDLASFAYVDKSDGRVDIDILKENFQMGTLKELDSSDELEEEVNKDEIEAGFIIEDSLEYKHVIKNNEMMDFSRDDFEEALMESYRVKGLSEAGIDYGQVQEFISPQVQSETQVLGKDSANNFLYTYILVFGLYFIIILYGQLIASGVASEKSNRAMEVLVTSTDSKNLIFGKVIGGALAGFTQFFVVIATAMITYSLNSSAWDNSLDFIFKIPGEVLLNFAVFGILGYLFYAFIYGALGALVSRTEDISASSTPITIIFIGVFFIAITGMQNTEGIILKIASFIPFSSFMAMFVRVSMGSVKTWEVLLSLGILFLSTILIGVLASKIYRMGTLRYGNPIKLKDALKGLRDD